MMISVKTPSVKALLRAISGNAEPAMDNLKSAGLICAIMLVTFLVLSAAFITLYPDLLTSLWSGGWMERGTE